MKKPDRFALVKASAQWQTLCGLLGIPPEEVLHLIKPRRRIETEFVLTWAWIKSLYRVMTSAPQATHLSVYGDAIQKQHGSITIEPISSRGSYFRQALHARRRFIVKRSSEAAAQRSITAEEIGLRNDRQLNVTLNGNEVLVLRGQNHDREVVCHFTDHPNRFEKVARHHLGLTAAHDFKTRTGSSLPLPSRLGFTLRDRSGYAAFQQELVRGRPGDQETSAPAASDQLRSLIEQYRAYFPPEPVRLTRESPAFAKYLALVPLINDIEPGQAKLLFQVLNRWIEEIDLATTLGHGDLWLGNILFQDNGSICAIVDWEWTCEHAPYALDLVHCILMSHIYVEGLSARIVLERVWRDQLDFKIPAFRLAAQVLQLPAAAIKLLATLAWLSLIERSHIRTGPQTPEWRATNISDVVKCFCEVHRPKNDNTEEPAARHPRDTRARADYRRPAEGRATTDSHD